MDAAAVPTVAYMVRRIGGCGDLPRWRTRAPCHLSAGEKKRAAFRRRAAHGPEILVLDEPTTVLDPPAQRASAALLARLPQSRLVVTHHVRFAAAVCNRTVFFQEGRIAAWGSVCEIAASFGWEF